MQRGIVYCILAALLLIAGSFQPNQSATAQDMVPVAYIPVVRGIDQQTIQNADFESGRRWWEDHSVFDIPQIMNIPAYLAEYPNSAPPAHSGDWLVWLGGLHDENGYIRQNIYIPPGQPHLTFWQIVFSEDDCENRQGPDVAVITAYNPVKGPIKYALKLCYEQNNLNWQKVSVDLSAFAGQTQTITFQVVTDSWAFSSLLIDDISLSADPVGGNWWLVP